MVFVEAGAGAHHQLPLARAELATDAHLCDAEERIDGEGGECEPAMRAKVCGPAESKLVSHDHERVNAAVRECGDDIIGKLLATAVGGGGWTRCCGVQVCYTQLQSIVYNAKAAHRYDRALWAAPARSAVGPEARKDVTQPASDFAPVQLLLQQRVRRGAQ